MRDLAELTQRLVKVWAAFEQAVADNAIGHWGKRLRASVEAKGRHFEHML